MSSLFFLLITIVLLIRKAQNCFNIPVRERWTKYLWCLHHSLSPSYRWKRKNGRTSHCQNEYVSHGICTVGLTGYSVISLLLLPSAQRKTLFEVSFLEMLDNKSLIRNFSVLYLGLLYRYWWNTGNFLVPKYDFFVACSEDTIYIFHARVSMSSWL